jgi:myotubularin-related protein 3/4
MSDVLVIDVFYDQVGQFRSARRIPAVVWRNTSNGAVLARCSQPEVSSYTVKKG